MTAADQATIDRNLAAARRFVDGVLGGAEPDAFGDVVHPRVTVETGLKPVGRIDGAAEYLAVLGSTLGTAFANGAMTIEEIAPLVDGRVIVVFAAQADNVGALNGVPATNRRFTFREMHLMRFDGEGRLVDNVVGALNPLMFEIWQAPATRAALLGEAS